MNAALDRIEAVLNEPELPDTGKQHLPAQAQPGQKVRFVYVSLDLAQDLYIRELESIKALDERLNA